MDSATNIDYEDERLDVGSVVLLTSLQKCMVRRMSYKMETTVRNEGESEGENEGEKKNLEMETSQLG